VFQTGSLENKYQYKTKETDTSGLVYFGARYYSPLLGRFYTPDPLGMVDGVNLYLYCGGDPVNFIDPWGLYLTPDEILENVDSGQDRIGDIIFSDQEIADGVEILHGLKNAVFKGIIEAINIG